MRWRDGTTDSPNPATVGAWLVYVAIDFLGHGVLFAKCWEATANYCQLFNLVGFWRRTSPRSRSRPQAKKVEKINMAALENAKNQVHEGVTQHYGESAISARINWPDDIFGRDNSRETANITTSTAGLHGWGPRSSPARSELIYPLEFCHGFVPSQASYLLSSFVATAKSYSLACAKLRIHVLSRTGDRVRLRR